MRDVSSIEAIITSVFILNPLRPDVNPTVVEYEATAEGGVGVGGREGTQTLALMLRKLPDLYFC